VQVSVSFFTTTVDVRSQPPSPGSLLLGKDPIEYFGWLYLKSLQSVWLQTLTNRHACGEGLPLQDLFTWMCAWVSVCTTSVALPVMAAQSWCFHSDTWGTVTVLPLQFVLCIETDRFVADCWCACVRFSSVPGTRRASALNMP